MDGWREGWMDGGRDGGSAPVVSCWMRRGMPWLLMMSTLDASLSTIAFHSAVVAFSCACASPAAHTRETDTTTQSHAKDTVTTLRDHRHAQHTPSGDMCTREPGVDARDRRERSGRERSQRRERGEGGAIETSAVHLQPRIELT
eukprot:750595-Rhodomonas_salina.1